jgi:hypothetical protein
MIIILPYVTGIKSLNLFPNILHLHTGDVSLVAGYKRTITLSHLYLLWVGAQIRVNVKPCPCYFLPTWHRAHKNSFNMAPSRRHDSHYLLTLFITRVRSPLSSSSGVGGRGLFGAPLDEGPVCKQSNKKFTQPKKNKWYMTLWRKNYL